MGVLGSDGGTIQSVPSPVSLAGPEQGRPDHSGGGPAGHGGGWAGLQAGGNQQDDGDL